MLRIETERNAEGKVTFTVTARGRGAEDLEELDQAYELLMTSNLKNEGKGSYNNSFSFTITSQND